MRYYPCVAHPMTGHLSIPVSPRPMSREEAEDWLRTRHADRWLRCEAIPQPEIHPYFTTRFPLCPTWHSVWAYLRHKLRD